MGWLGFYALLLVTAAPHLGDPRELRKSTVSVALMSVASVLLRPVCRGLVARPLSWFGRELRAFGWSEFAGGLAAGIATPLIGAGAAGFEWQAWLLVLWVEFTVVLFLWSSLFLSIKQWQHGERERERLLRAEAEVRDARLRALRYQLNPHFLFNSLNAISTLVVEGNAGAASRMLSQISQFLRDTLDTEVAAEVPLWREMELAGRYLAIEQTRLGERLQINFDIASDTFDALVPGLFLQPLVENAVRHGIAPLLEGGAIRIRTERRGARLRVTIGNSGPATGGAGAKGIGLTNTASRLETLYGADCSFAFRRLDSGECEATLDLPFRPCLQETGAAALCVS
jgi:hypothetical protein